jgi:hypothetical protein
LVANDFESLRQEAQEIIDRDLRVVQDSTKCARSDRFVIRNDHTRWWFVTSQHHVAATLPLKSESSTFQRASDVATG